MQFPLRCPRKLSSIHPSHQRTPSTPISTVNLFSNKDRCRQQTKLPKLALQTRQSSPSLKPFMISKTVYQIWRKNWGHCNSTLQERCPATQRIVNWFAARSFRWKESYCDFRSYATSFFFQQNPTTVLSLPLLFPRCSEELIFRLTRELEKKFSDRHVVFIGQRRIMRKPGRKSRQKQPRPMSRTLTSVHDKILEDLVFPTEIVGKRTRVYPDGRKIIKVYVSSEWSSWIV